jgi:AraC-like DNA-binding protein
MKEIVYMFLAGLALAACSAGNGSGSPVDTDSTYTWENIRQSCYENPQYSLALIDTAEMKGIADENSANGMRARVWHNTKEPDKQKARAYCQKVLDNNPDSLERIKALMLMTAICVDKSEWNEDLVRYAIEGALLAHNLGLVTDEADFYFGAGKVMEQKQRGSGMHYIDRSLNICREAAEKSPEYLAMLSSYLGQKARIIAMRENYAGVIPLLKERLPIIARIDKEVPDAPAGWTDGQRAYTYSVLAYCQQKTGDTAGARRSAEAFERTDAAKLPQNKYDILNYYALVGNSERILQIYQEIEPILRKHEDTISVVYRGLVMNYANGLHALGRYREASLARDRCIMLSDSLVQRERQGETLKLAQLMKTQEKELALKDKEAQARIHLIIILSLLLILTVCAVVLWRIVIAQRRLHQKNRELFDIVQQMLSRAEYQQKDLEEKPVEMLTSLQQLYRRLCTLMRDKQPYTDSDLKREDLAAMLGTNFSYVADAIRECADGMTLGDFLDDWRIRHAARLLGDTGEPIGLVAEMSGFQSRSHFNTLFREKFKMTPSEYRKISNERK